MPQIEEFVPHNFNSKRHTVAQVLNHAVANYGEKTFVKSVEGNSLTYQEFDCLTNRFAHGLADFGINFQEPVLYMLPDNLDILIVWGGLAKRGAIGVPINLAYRGKFLSRIMNDAGAKILIIAEELLERLEEITDELIHLKYCVVYDSDGDVEPSQLFPRIKMFARVSFSELFSDSECPFEPGPSIQDLMGVMYTSGTTGASKGVMVTHAHAFKYAQAVGRIHGVVFEDIFYSSGLPLFHIAGQWGVAYCTMIYGATACIRSGYRNDYFWMDIKEHRGTVVFLLGAIANFLWQQPVTANDADTPLKKVGMFPVIPEHAAFAERFGVKIATGYGSTENPGGFIHHFDEPFPTNQCVGIPDEDVDASIRDELDRECANNEMGEICIRHQTPWTIMRGYWNLPEATAKAFRNLWFHTGDAGYRDDQGRFYFVDRLTDSMRRRGENISSMEVEDEINQHPALLECAVFPVWDEHTEQEIMTVVVLKNGFSLDPADLITFLDKRLPYFMIPRYVEISSKIPKTPTGKMEKYQLRERGIGPSTWDRVAVGVKLSR